jgi:hypothetical protein
LFRNAHTNVERVLVETAILALAGKSLRQPHTLFARELFTKIELTD